MAWCVQAFHLPATNIELTAKPRILANLHDRARLMLW